MTTRTSTKEKRRELADAKRRQAAPAEVPGAPSPGIIERDEFLYTDTRTVRRGDLFKISGGPRFTDGRRWVLVGIFRFESAWLQGKHWKVCCHRIDPDAIDRKTGKPLITSTHVIVVAGPDYPHPQVAGLIVKPYRIHRLLDETARKSGLQGMTRSAAAEARR